MFPSKSSRSVTGGYLSLFGLPFFAAGMFMTWVYFSGLVDWWRARSWVEVPCRIESVELKSSGKGSSRTVATYAYRYEGRNHTGDRVQFFNSGDNIGGFQRDAFGELSAHRREFRCFVNPADPSESVIYRKLRWSLQALIAIFTLTFPAVGAGLMIAGLVGSRTLGNETRLRHQFPAEPWKWKPEWEDSAIPEHATSRWTALLAYTLWSGAIILPLMAAMVADHAFSDRLAFIILIFPALWCGVAWFSLKRLRHRLAVGEIRLELPARPVNPGDPLQGHLLLARPLPSRGEAEFTLVCEKSTSRTSSEGVSTSTEKIRSRRESVATDRLLRDISGFRLPVRLTVPADAPECSRDANAEPKLAWKLEFTVPGTAIRSVFEIPVFHTDQPRSVPLLPDTGRGDLGELLAAAKIKADFNSSGFPLAITCPPTRYLAVIGFFVVFDTIWTAGTVLLVSRQAPMLVGLGFSTAAAAMWLAVIWMALHRRTVNFSDSGLEIQHRFGPLTWGSTFPKSQILAFSQNTKMTSGNTTYYRVQLEAVTGRKTTLVDGITGEAAAAALVTRLDEWRNPQA